MRTLTISFVAFLLTLPLMAATVRGRVQDHGYAIPGTRITIHRHLSSVSTLTNADGAYVFENVRPGKYVVRAEIVGLKMGEEPKPFLVEQEDVNVDITMLVEPLRCITVVPAQFHGPAFTMSQSDADKLPLGH
jgi:hypothetical protein